MTGTLVASFAWALLLEGVLRLVLPQGFETWRYVVYPLMLLLIMLLRPKGMFGDYEMPFLRQLLPPLTQEDSCRTRQFLPPAPSMQEAQPMSDPNDATSNQRQRADPGNPGLDHAVRRPAGGQ